MLHKNAVGRFLSVYLESTALPHLMPEAFFTFSVINHLAPEKNVRKGVDGPSAASSSM